MSDLQLWLAVIGGLVLAALVAYNTWTSRRNRPRQADPDDMQIASEDPAGLSVQPNTIDLDELAAMGEARISVPATDRRAQLDVLIDAIAQIDLEHSVSGDAVLAHMPATRRVGSKPFAVEGLNHQTRQWEFPQTGQRYDILQAGVQLANRSGPLNEIEYSEFIATTQVFADHLNGTPDVPEMRAEIARARELDQFASSHDALLSMTLKARQTAWSPGFVQQYASRLGFVAGVLPGRMVLPSSAPGQPPLLVLTVDAQAAMSENPDQSALRELLLTLEVTHVERLLEPFGVMRDVAQKLALNTGALLMDDMGRLLTEAAMNQIAVELEHIYNQLDAHELSAGSALARRLFS
jgi:hypothetical protein